jgi:hypothetical protein
LILFGLTSEYLALREVGTRTCANRNQCDDKSSI